MKTTFQGRTDWITKTELNRITIVVQYTFLKMYVAQLRIIIL